MPYASESERARSTRTTRSRPSTLIGHSQIGISVEKDSPARVCEEFLSGGSVCVCGILINIRALHGSASENRSKWYGLGVPPFFKRCGIWFLRLRYMMVRLPTPRFFEWYLVTVSQNCGKQMTRYMLTIFLRGRQMARYMVLRSINFLRGRQTARLR